MQGLISRRINKQHRLVYEIFEDEKWNKVYRMWDITHNKRRNKKINTLAM